MSITVVIADDQSMVRAGFRLILAAQPGIEVIGEAADGQQAVQAARRLVPTIMLMDIRMPVLDGLAATRRILLTQPPPPTRVVMLTTFDADAYVYEALRAGASGFLLKDAPPEQLVEGVRMAAAGDALFAPSVTRRLVESYVQRPRPGTADDPALEALTDRERQVLHLLARGWSNAEIAAHLHLSEATIKTHVGNVFAKLDLRDRVHAVVFAYEAGLVQPGTH
jgi:DNA-binding NarL/FixJ family response regulator